MEEKTKSLASHAMVYCLIPAAAMIIYGTILYLFNMNLNKVLSSLSYIFLIAGMIYGTLQYRKEFSNGFMTYSKAFTSSFLISLFCIIIVSIFNFIFYTFIDPGIIQQMSDMAREEMMTKAPDLTDQQLESALAMQAKFMSPVALTIMSLIMGTIAGAILSLIMAIFLRKEDKSIPTVA